MTTVRTPTVGGLLLVALATTGCSGGSAEVTAGPLTTGKVVAIAADHLDDPTSTDDAEIDGSDPRRSLGARLRYDDQHVDVVVGPPREVAAAEACRDSTVECAELATSVDGASLTLAWQLLTPEEDPGIVVLLLEREDEFSLVRWGGDVEVTDDPRELDLAVSVDDATALLEDGRLRREVDPDA